MPVKASLSSIQFHFQHKGPSLKNRQLLKTFIANLFKKEKTALNSMQYIFCSDDYLLEINQQFLQHDYYTDIITFNLAEKNHPVEGEVYISLDRIKENALTLNQQVDVELHRVIFHGVLHLCGYRDKSKKNQTIMRAKENYYLKKYFK